MIRHFILGLIAISTFIWGQEIHFEYQIQAFKGRSSDISVELIDGSVWRIDQRFLKRVQKDWTEDDFVTIYPLSSRWYLPWSKPKFAFHNSRTKNLVLVELTSGPKDYKKFAAYVTNIRPRHYDAILEIGFNNGKRVRFSVPKNHFSELRNWKKGNSLLIGSNMVPDAQDLFDSNFMIINTSRNSYITVDELD